MNGVPIPPRSGELGWKDTIQADPGTVTVILARFAPIDGTSDYPFDATIGPGYVLHCHILDPEDNEMMRPFVVVEEKTLLGNPTRLIILHPHFFRQADSAHGHHEVYKGHS